MGEPNNDDDNSFLQGFMARAKQRQAKLAQINEIVANSATNDNQRPDDVSYPPLSPLPEEGTISPETLNTTNNTTKDDTISDDEADDENLDENDDDDDDDDVEEATGRKYYKTRLATRNSLATARARPPSPSVLNYSSDLSLSFGQETNENDLHRAEPAICRSSPDREMRPPPRPSPRKQLRMSKDIPLQQQYPQQQALPGGDSIVPSAPPQGSQSGSLKNSSQSLPEHSASDKIMKDLEIRLNRACKHRAQFKDLVELSDIGSKEHIEAARRLQVTETEHLCLTNFITLYGKGIRRKTESLGSVEVNSIHLKLTAKMRNDLAEKGIFHYFFCVASYGTDVKATEIINTEDIRRQDLKQYLQFKEKICFTNLPSDFAIKFEVFELIARPQATKFLSRLTPSKKSRITPEYFRRIGSMKLSIGDRKSDKKNLTHFTSSEESKYLEKELRFTLKLKPEQLPYKSGMLNVRCLDHNWRPDWTRFWVELKDGWVRFWKSNQDADGKKPNLELELRIICTQSVQRLTPDDDLYRQHSFVFYSYQQVQGGDRDNLLQRILPNDPMFKIVKHQLAAENKEDRDSWCSILDKSMNCFREWNETEKVYSIDELKEIFSNLY